MNTATQDQDSVQKPSKVRYSILAMLFIATALNYGDRSTLSIAGSSLASDMGFSSVTMGYMFSAFSWAYVIAQIPGGWLLDRFGSKKVYCASLFFWSLFTLLQGAITLFSGLWAVIILFSMRFMVGIAESPCFPGNSRITAAWFPAGERGTAAAIFNSAQYFATVIFAPVMGWLTHNLGWRSVFFFMGSLGISMCILWIKAVNNPRDHPKINAAELEHISKGGALIDMDAKKEDGAKKQGPSIAHISQLFSSRMLLGIFFAQFCINGLTYFFITWFPVYLVKARGLTIIQTGLVAAIPAICGFIGGILGGVVSDALIRRTGSLTLARKIPIILGMLLSTSIVLCNYVDTTGLVVFFMSLSFFGKGFGALGWAVMSDTAPKEISGLAGGVFNMCGNIAGILTPIAIGYIVSVTGSFHGALLYVALHAVGAMFAYLFVVGTIERMELRA